MKSVFIGGTYCFPIDTAKHRRSASVGPQGNAYTASGINLRLLRSVKFRPEFRSTQPGRPSGTGNEIWC